MDFQQDQLQLKAHKQSYHLYRVEGQYEENDWRNEIHPSNLLDLKHEIPSEWPRSPKGRQYGYFF